jgi:hypothetical protein
MTYISKTASVPNETLHELIEVLLAEESDVEDIAYAASWLSLNFFALNPKVRNELTKCLNQLCELQPIIILETIEYLFNEDRENELILLIQLLRCAPDVYKQIKHVAWDPEISSSYRIAHILLTDEENTMMDEDAWGDEVDQEEV